MVESINLFFKGHIFFEILIFAVLLDTLLGVLRAIKEHKFNSSTGIDGMIRKVAMLLSMIFLMLIDSIIQFDFLFLIPNKYLQYLGVDRLGICAFFCILYILFESISILKNMTLCGLPVPRKIKEFIQKFLDNMTTELPDEIGEVQEPKGE